jgi:rhodanese-related sulfurtransferase
MFGTTRGNSSHHPSERPRHQTGFLVIGLGAALLVFPPAFARADFPPGESETRPGTRSYSYPSYCGVQSLYRALRALGKDVRFADLLRAEYVSSKKGSSVADLKQAGKDFGVLVEPMRQMTCGTLQRLDCPVILHVKFDLGSNAYDHWILFMGTEGGKAKIYDRDLPATEMGFDELAARWDGTGLLVSNSPINRTGIWLAVVCRFLLYAGLAAFVVGLLFRLERRWGRLGGRASWAGAVCHSIGQAAGLLLIALGAMAGYRLGSDDGFLSSPTAVAAIQDSHFGTFLPKVSTEGMARLLDTPGVAIVDARLPDDFQAGHLKGAISIPVGSSPSKCELAMAAVPKEHRIVVYSHSNGCPFGDKVAKVLISLGYHDVLLYRGGWVEWEKHYPSGKSRQLVKGDQG